MQSQEFLLPLSWYLIVAQLVLEIFKNKNRLGFKQSPCMIRMTRISDFVDHSLCSVDDTFTDENI